MTMTTISTTSSSRFGWYGHCIICKWSTWGRAASESTKMMRIRRGRAWESATTIATVTVIATVVAAAATVDIDGARHDQ